MFDLFWLVEGVWTLDESSTLVKFNTRRKALSAEAKRISRGRCYKIRKKK